MVQTACFALSNLARGPNAHLEEFFEAGIAPKLASHLINNTVSIKLFMLHNNLNAFSLIYSYYYQPDTVTEICWVLSYLTAGTDQFIGKLLDEGIAPLLVRSLILFCWVHGKTQITLHSSFHKLILMLILQVQNLGPLQSQGPLALPLIRTCGNIASGPDDYTDILINEEPFLPGIIALCQSDCRQGFDAFGALPLCNT